MGAFVWKNMCIDVARIPMMSERRKALRDGDNEAYKAVVKKLGKME